MAGVEQGIFTLMGLKNVDFPAIRKQRNFQSALNRVATQLLAKKTEGVIDYETALERARILIDPSYQRLTED